MNVLIYTRSSPTQQPITVLRDILSPNYTVQSITTLALTKDPWQDSCALLVLVGDGGFNAPSVVNKQLAAFVGRGGKCLVLGAGVNVVELGLGLGLESGLRGLMIGALEEEEEPLSFVDRRRQRKITISSRDHEEVQLAVSDGLLAVYDDILAQDELLNSVLTKLGLVLPQPASSSSPTPVFLVSSPHATDTTIIQTIVASIRATSPAQHDPGSKLIQLKLTQDADEFWFHAYDLKNLDTQHSEGAEARQSRGNPRHIVYLYEGHSPPRSVAPSFDLGVYFEALEGGRLDASAEVSWRSNERSLEPENTKTGGRPQRKIGQLLLYAEAIPSTQTLFDKNPTLTSHLETPLLSLASRQLSGRGRGANIWLSPKGCLTFSLLLRVPLASTLVSSYPSSPISPSKLVFIQYLFALALTEACRHPDVVGLQLGERVRIKWPNDLIADFGLPGVGEQDLRKIGGILVNTNFQGGMADIIIGCGLNVLTDPPIASLSQLQSLNTTTTSSTLPNQQFRTPVTMERTLACILVHFSKMWDVFLCTSIGGSFEPFVDLYKARWLHSDQIVTLTTTTPPMQVRILGITLDYGLLRTLRVGPVSVSGSGGTSSSLRRTDAVGLLGDYAARVDGGASRAFMTGGPEYIDLQPDGNSFDLMKGLIRAKT